VFPIVTRPSPRKKSLRQSPEGGIMFLTSFTDFDKQ
jgi:hypothetical protein